MKGIKMIEVPLTQGKVALIDDDSAWLLERHRKWHAVRYKSVWYAEAKYWKGGRSYSVKMHRVLTNCPKGMVVDHKNGDPLDNRISNLRVCTQAENLMNARLRSDNKSGYRGVYFDAQSQRWRAVIHAHNKRFRLGSFDSPLEAHLAYCKASERLHGEFGRTS